MQVHDRYRTPPKITGAKRKALDDILALIHCLTPDSQTYISRNNLRLGDYNNAGVFGVTEKVLQFEAALGPDADWEPSTTEPKVVAAFSSPPNWASSGEPRGAWLRDKMRIEKRMFETNGWWPLAAFFDSMVSARVAECSSRSVCRVLIPLGLLSAHALAGHVRAERERE